MSEPINFDNDSSIWNYPPNREISRNEPPYSMTKPAPDPYASPPGPALQGGLRSPPNQEHQRTARGQQRAAGE
ncbi:unnamed protein product [Boreogadus saida]